MKSIRTKAIVLRRTNYGEADRIVQVLTPEGCYGVLARGVRKEKSRLASGIELLSVSDVVMGQGRGELRVLTAAKLLVFYGNVMHDYSKLQFAYEVLKQVGRASDTMTDEPEWFDLVQQVLVGLNGTTVSLEVVAAWFYVRLSSLLGYELNTATDGDGNKLEAELLYTYDDAEQSLRKKANGDINAEHIKLFRLLAAQPLEIVARVGGINRLGAECLNVARRHAALG